MPRSGEFLTTASLLSRSLPPLRQTELAGSEPISSGDGSHEVLINVERAVEDAQDIDVSVRFDQVRYTIVTV